MAERRMDEALAGPRASAAVAGDEAPLVAVPMANNPEVIGAIAAAMEVGIARFALIGPTSQILAVAEEAEVELGEAMIENEPDPVRACARAAAMASAGEAQVLMKGLVQTADFVRSILDRELGLVPVGNLLSHVALCDVERYDRLFLLTDAAITTYPEADAKARLVENALACADPLGVERPACAMVAPVEKVSEKVPSTTDAASVVAAFADDERIAVDGPFGLDVAVSPAAATVKGIDGPVAGHADILVMPNIDAANAVYKSLVAFAGARVAGIVAGAAVPAVLTSRADSEQSKFDALRFALAVARQGAD
ncbi:MAG: phosphate acyltransferase [Spirochaetota bacterium]